jgi:class I fructose-bisphosphate aldolase
MDLGKQVRLNRIFSHPSGRLCSVAVDHFLNYHEDMPEGLRDLPKTIRTVLQAKPDAMTMHRGTAAACWGEHAGKVPLIVQSVACRIDDSADEIIATPEDALRLGADAYATACLIRGKTEGLHLRRLADQVRAAAPWSLPVIVHIYPRKYHANGAVEIVSTPEDVAWAIRCAIEVGVDVIKTPYCGDKTIWKQLVDSCPLPLVAAGGPKCETIGAALQLMADAVAAGGRGAVIGRNVWGFKNVVGAVQAFKAVVHDGVAPAAAMKAAGLG